MDPIRFVKHLHHIEELPLLYGSRGVRLAHALIDDLLQDPLDLVVTNKVDGAPAVVFGHLPTGEKFVATKSYFNVTPQFYLSKEEIVGVKYKKALPPRVAVLLCDLFDAVPANGNEIFHGDVIAHPTCVTDLANGVTHCPNVVAYTWSREEWEAQFGKARMVVVVHTTYRDGHAKFGTTIPKSSSEDVHFSGNVHPFWSSSDEFRSSEPFVAAVREWLSISKRVQQLADASLDDLEIPNACRVVNSFIRTGTPIPSAEAIMDALAVWVDDDGYFPTLAKLEASLALMSIKPHLLQLGTPFAGSRATIANQPTHGEGIVVADDTIGIAVKMIDRYTFSYHNFNTPKNWT